MFVKFKMLQTTRKVAVTNPEMPPENLTDKFCRLDVNMTVNGQRVDLEIQVLSEISDNTCYVSNVV
jgi:hypothetical protein